MEDLKKKTDKLLDSYKVRFPLKNLYLFMFIIRRSVELQRKQKFKVF